MSFPQGVASPLRSTLLRAPRPVSARNQQARGDRPRDPSRGRQSLHPKPSKSDRVDSRCVNCTLRTASAPPGCRLQQVQTQARNAPSPIDLPVKGQKVKGDMGQFTQTSTNPCGEETACSLRPSQRRKQPVEHSAVQLSFCIPVVVPVPVLGGSSEARHVCDHLDPQNKFTKRLLKR